MHSFHVFAGSNLSYENTAKQMNKQLPERVIRELFMGEENEN